MDLKFQTSSISKRQKSNGKAKHVVCPTGAAVGGEDRIGRLPDAMLCHILSFLETEDSVRTSVLSKRWRGVWTSVPCIEFLSPMGGRHFIDFLDRVLHLNTVSCLRKLSLTWSIHYERLHEWITTVMERDIEEIDLEFWGNQPIKFPPTIFTCKKLVVLKLNYEVLLDVPSSVYLPSLKILHLYLAKNFCEESLKNLLDGCPVLEELDINDVEDGNLKSLIVRSSSLKSLSIQFNCMNGLRIIVDVPNVERLDLTDNGKAEYHINSLPSLIKVSIYIGQDSSSNRLVELLENFTTTEYLLISSHTVKRLEYQQLDDLPVFHNLTHLVVSVCDPSLPVLPALLECSPNLVTFESRKGRPRQQHLQFKAPKCLMLYLEEIKLGEFKGLMYEMEMVRYFFKNSPVLKKLSIQSYAGAKKSFEISKKLLKFPRGSPECEVTFE